MSVWILDALCVLALLVGTRFFDTKFLRRISFIAIVYLAIFFVCYYLWLHIKFVEYKANPGIQHIGISSAFVFEGFWTLFGNMFLLNGILPVAMFFVILFGVKWLTTYSGPGTKYY